MIQFKLVNDTYGHGTGDQCLVKIGKLLKAFANRPGDICARYGGEEFVLLWGDTPLASAVKLANHVLKQLTELKIPNKNSPIADYVTASIGLSEIVPAQGSQAHDIVAKADVMLYRAKENGRNRVVY